MNQYTCKFCGERISRDLNISNYWYHVSTGWVRCYSSLWEQPGPMAEPREK